MEQMIKKVEHFPTAKKLHTDVLEEKYGPIHSEILEHNDELREVLLSDKEGIARTYALTFFPVNRENELNDVNQEIKAGGMIGKSFRDNGYEVRKNVVDVFIIDIPKWLQKKFAVEKNHAKARISEFYAKKQVGAPVIYGYVLEVYSPDFRDPSINDIDMAQVNPSTEMFKSIGIGEDKIWERLERSSEENEWIDLGDDFKKVKMKTMPFVFELKNKMESRINVPK